MPPPTPLWMGWPTIAGGKASLTLDADALMQSSGGSQIKLDSNALAESSGGSKVLLDGNATVSTPGEGKLEAPTAVLSGGKGASTVKNDAAGVAVTGAKITLNG